MKVDFQAEYDGTATDEQIECEQIDAEYFSTSDDLSALYEKLIGEFEDRLDKNAHDAAVKKMISEMEQE